MSSSIPRGAYGGSSIQGILTRARRASWKADQGPTRRRLLQLSTPQPHHGQPTCLIWLERCHASRPIPLAEAPEGSSTPVLPTFSSLGLVAVLEGRDRRRPAHACADITFPRVIFPSLVISSRPLSSAVRLCRSGSLAEIKKIPARSCWPGHAPQLPSLLPSFVFELQHFNFAELFWHSTWSLLQNPGSAWQR
jgi:hypothetical protein